MESSEVGVLIGLVENRKQIHLSPQERACLQADLCSLGESIQELRERAEWVVRNKDYGRISFDVWLAAKPTYTQEEFELGVQRRIRERREQLGRLHIPVEELENAGLVELGQTYERRREETYERIFSKLKARTKRVKAFIQSADESVKLEIKAIAEGKGLIKDDPYWRDILPLCAPELLNEVEAIMRRV